MQYIFGHKNPDTDSICSALALSYYYNNKNIYSKPFRLGPIQPETKFVLDYINISPPNLLENVFIQISDLPYNTPSALNSSSSLVETYKQMETEGIRTIAIVDDNNKILGLVTMKDIAMHLMHGDFYEMHSTMENIKNNLDGIIHCNYNEEIKGAIPIIASHSELMEKGIKLSPDSIVILSDVYAMVEKTLDSKIKLLVVCGVNSLPIEIINKAKAKKINLMTTSKDIYRVSKIITRSNSISTIMRTNNILSICEDEYLNEIKDMFENERYNYFPVVDKNNRYLGLLNRAHLLSPTRKKVVLVDHNELNQSALGIEEAEIIEIIDHHKLGGLITHLPMSFLNKPLGSTCSLIYEKCIQENINISKEIAILLLAGIISDTLCLQSPTTTDYDREIVIALAKKTNVNYREFATQMFEEGDNSMHLTLEQLIKKDYKEFNIEGERVGISQLFTLSCKRFKQEKESLEKELLKRMNDKNLSLILFVVTDILNNGSYIYFKSTNPSILRQAFSLKNTPAQGFFVENLLSRKKQILPALASSFIKY